MEFHGTDGFPETAIRLVSGEIFDYEHPEDAVITYHDIAHALSRESRFAGHAGLFYTVGHHALFVAILVAIHYNQPELALAALHHDDVEAFTKDWPSPMKRFIKAHGFDYKREMERPIEQAISKQLGLVLDDLHAGVIKDADRLAFVTEGTLLKPGFDRHDQGFDDIDVETIKQASIYMGMMDVGRTEQILMNVHDQLMNGADAVRVFKSIGALALKDAMDESDQPQDDEDSPAS